MSLEEMKNELIDLYLKLKIRKLDKMTSLTEEELQKEKNNLIKISIKELINYIANSIEILIEIKACEKFIQKMQIENSKNNYINTEDDSDKNGLKLYEGMLIKAERDIRGHIKVIN